MRIAFDRQAFTIQKYGGISRYFTDLYIELAKLPGIEAKLLFSWHQNAYLSEHKIGKKLSPFPAKVCVKAMAKSNLSMPLERSADIQHSTFYLGQPPRDRKKTKLVSTLYDMIPELFPAYFKKNPHVNKLKWLKASDLIVSISDCAAADLSYFQPSMASRICRIHLYSSFTELSRQSKPFAFNQDVSPYMLFVGQRGAYKNARMILRAFAASDPRTHGSRLIFAGGGSFSAPELADIGRLKITDYVQQLGVSDSELWYLYRNASAILVPSIAEGFSLPLVEALAANVPVICSDIPVHREVAGDFGELINPLQYQDWADMIKAYASLAKPVDKLGLEVYKARRIYYSKERMVKEHVMLYKALVDQ